jgi:hypothetical protein
MANKRRFSEAQLLEDYRVTFKNTEKQAIIATTMSDFGYDSAELEKGKALLATANARYDENKQEDDETIAARAVFDELAEEVADAYKSHRKKGKSKFRKDEVALKTLALTGLLSRVYVKWLEAVKIFYKGLTDHPEWLTIISKLKVSAEDIAACQAKIADLEDARADYLREIGEDQEATRQKNLAFIALDDWMIDFYETARIAMEDKPQLLETIGLLVRS